MTYHVSSGVLNATAIYTAAQLWSWLVTEVISDHTDLCPCGETQTMSHIVESCPLTKLNGSLSRPHSADEDAISWLTSYDQWHAYEKKKMKITEVVTDNNLRYSYATVTDKQWTESLCVWYVCVNMYV